MKPLLVLAAGLLACNAHAQGPFTPKEELSALFDTEGRSPFPAPYAGTLVFSALQSRYVSGNGHGYRNELKLANRHRRSVASTREHFSARVTPVLADGAKTIVAQYHAEGLDTLLKVYVQDTAERKAMDGEAGNGVFDVLVRIKGTDGQEATTALGTIRSGESFELDIALANGSAIVTGKTSGNGVVGTGPTRVKPDGGAIYFKFGDYLQALDPATQMKTSSPERWDEYYRQQHMEASQVTFSEVIFQRQPALSKHSL